MVVVGMVWCGARVAIRAQMVILNLLAVNVTAKPKAGEQKNIINQIILGAIAIALYTYKLK